ncbi:hypothetical protein ADIS_1755 [Lunatimonas lonarensis]|uniref:Neutral/alkaline non-lysosomal ceramidase N-terminal domain-containing protein n=1 Tax=Lunatimonas lonarensis TaxID=1232681 RepID=R7ZUK6_9BACT|nr:hypothetical protein [Lunatimonas lonarensis]EON77836.1 hypothetical protein ADIS_1755 [Lunatimonas lonarensis]
MNSNTGLHAAAAQVETTPRLGTVINGDFVPHYATSIHDPLFAKALVLRRAGISLVFVVVDICVMGQGLLDEVKYLIQKKAGISAANILISSTHTHAAGAVEEVHFVQADLAYRKWLPGRILQAVETAIARLEPAHMGYGKVLAPEHLRCRRYQMEEDYQPLNPVTDSVDLIKTNPFGVEDKIIHPVGKPDPELYFVALQGISGRWISVLANYGLHYVGDWQNGTISADYFGYFARALQVELGAGEDFVSIMSNGTSGDVNIWDFHNPNLYPTGDFEKSTLIGADLAARVAKAMVDIQWDADPDLRANTEVLSVARRMPSDEELDAAKRLIAEGGFETLQADYAGWRKLYAREQHLLADYPTEARVPLQCFRLGSLCIGALPGEIFASTGIALKEAIKGPYFSITLANGNLGYIPPARELEKGGYETWRCRISNLESGAERRIREEMIRLADSV